ncbi:hypothetical protein CBLAS_0427 [Campylobacter blaseri]|uniref:Uncharacterized protein n=1 Tax=Campylobacter blaseri TaxID=2042961 RepID=A0A2P8R0K6_9BACT|nr:hypothetical protein [Campylobacter blaseri]PSM52033.1 hypothetical protein CQ405_05600 [Campylobacter blaseri]PSM53818.1 hypothetical protein CRN67_05600 [Campylobacter blaseri]QKF85630.1 hypothetical protein CBLAS_0427 [Campylobacter blaseri]
MNNRTIGYVKSIQGLIVKRDVILCEEENLKAGDLLYIDDSVWARSLDAKAVLALHKKEIELSAGMRITLDKEFLKQNNSYEFFTQEEIEQIKKSSSGFDIQLDPDFNSKIISFDNPIDIDNEKGSENYEDLEIDYRFVLHKKELIFRVYCNESIDIKAYLVGSSGYILEKPIELNSQMATGSGNKYFIVKNRFVKPNLYLIYLNILNTKNKGIHKEVFCEVDIRI